MSDYESIFTQIYKNRTWSIFPWVPLSGTGSSIKNTVKYCGLLKQVLKEKQIKSVIDLGCGDWTFSKKIDWTGIQYLGIDIASHIIKENQGLYGKDNVRFLCKNLIDYKGILPYADLWIIKDVFQHWSNKDISDFLTLMFECQCFKYILLTNTNTEDSNRDISPGQFRPLNPKMSPLVEYNPVILEYENGKAICLITYMGVCMQTNA